MVWLALPSFSIGCSTNATRLSSEGDGTFCIANGDEAIKFLGFEPVSTKHAGTFFFLIRILFFSSRRSRLFTKLWLQIRGSKQAWERGIHLLSSLRHPVGECRRAKKSVVKRKSKRTLNDPRLRPTKSVISCSLEQAIFLFSQASAMQVSPKQWGLIKAKYSYSTTSLTFSTLEVGWVKGMLLLRAFIAY